ncbi:phospholipase B1, membrane-associated-like [Rhopilema esculentum]|uniref:phospholipase B1, membrane-associated-like n=1 Tax=Rhopilema esculentum TaxID=499914 RepID=UPI0031DAE57E
MGRRFRDSNMEVQTGCFYVVPRSLFAIVGFIALIKATNNNSSTQQKAYLGYIWENPRAENHNAEEVIVDGSNDELRLTCILDPPLPLTKENFISRDKIVKWMRIQKTHGHQIKSTFWSDDQGITAISLSKLKLRDLGTYGCSYRSYLKTINLTVSNIAEIQRLPEAKSHSDLEGAVLNIKEVKGLESWKPLPGKEKGSFGMTIFPCSVPTTHNSKANSVNQLQPKDIDVILSLGGAFSTGVATGSLTVPGLFSSHKTRSFSIGGKLTVEHFITLPSILKKFNPSLKGAIFEEETFSTINYGSSIRQLPRRALNLIRKLETRKDVDFERSWKLLTLSLDFDDYCIACRLESGWDDHLKSVVETLDTLHSKVPRLFVNLVLAPNVTQLYSSPSSQKCSQLYRKSCECMDSQSDEDKTKVAQMQNDMKKYMAKIVHKYNTGPNFTVVVQPFWTDIISDREDLFAKDCFHLSSVGQELAAVNLWNNMLEPVDLKHTQWITRKSLRCPTPTHPFFFTFANSRKVLPSDFPMADTIEVDVAITAKSKSTMVALGVGLSLFVVVVVVTSTILIYIKKQSSVPMRDRIRILATPWKRMKEKV